MNIGITCYPTHGGSGVVATELGLALAARGHEVHFIASSLPVRLQDGYHPGVYFHEVEVSTYPLFRNPPYVLALASKMVEVTTTYKLDILHVHYAIPHAIAAFLARQIAADAGVRVVTTLHGTDISLVGRERAYFAPTQFAIAASDGVTAVSAALRDETHALFGRPPETIAVIPNFVDTTRFVPKCLCEKRHCLAPEGEPIVMHISNFRPVKRPVDVVTVFAEVRRERQAKLVLVGDGPELGAVRARGEALGVAGDMHFLGNQDAVWDLLPLADAFLLPSESESFGLAALEALACGVPVIATNAGGLPEVVKHGITGYLGKVGDTAGMANHVRTMFDDRDVRQALATAAREDVVARFDVTQIVPRYERFYDTVLTRAPNP